MESQLPWSKFDFEVIQQDFCLEPCKVKSNSGLVFLDFKLTLSLPLNSYCLLIATSVSLTAESSPQAEQVSSNVNCPLLCFMLISRQVWLHPSLYFGMVVLKGDESQIISQTA